MPADIGPVQLVPISKIKLNVRNSKIHSAKQIRQIANSIVAFGFVNALLVNEDLELIAGHGRYKAAELLGFNEVPVRVIAGLSPTKQRALAIADNKIAQNSKWNRDRLAIEIPELADSLTAEGLDVSILGFESIEIEHLVQTDFPKVAANLEDRIDAKWGAGPIVSKPGDLWVLGHHRLLCGTGCPDADITRLMIGRRADMAFFDPTAAKEVSVPGNPLCTTFEAAAAVSRKGAIHFVCMGWQYASELIAAAKPIYGEPIDVVVWVKAKAGEGAFYRGQHELIGVFAVGGEAHRHLARHKRSNVWHYAAVKGPATAKPVALLADAIEDCTKKGDIVLGTSSGSGTTIMAAERTGPACPRDGGRRRACRPRRPPLAGLDTSESPACRKWLALRPDRGLRRRPSQGEYLRGHQGAHHDQHTSRESGNSLEAPS